MCVFWRRNVMKFELHAKRTEPEWSDALYRFVASLVQAVFPLVRWAMIIAAVSYLHDPSGHWTLWLTNSLLHGLLIARILTYFTCRFGKKASRPYSGRSDGTVALEPHRHKFA